jgi:hypothetical protein
MKALLRSQSGIPLSARNRRLLAGTGHSNEERER